MRLDLLNGEENVRDIGAVVVRASTNGELCLELGPADGPPRVVLKMTTAEAGQLTSAVQTISQSGGETILIFQE
jgi:hypothetical protein